jgi:hypothetical protein
MQDDLRERLEKKGWTREDIDKTISILETAEENKKPARLLFDKFVYWLALIVSIAGNFVISIVLIPVLITLKSTLLYAVIAILGLVFGFLFSLLMGDIGELDKRHNVISGIFIPTIAVINMFVFVNLSNYLSKLMIIENKQNPVLVSIIYVFFFSAPYLYGKIRDKIKK